jgi:hypothetical protein
MVFLTPPRDLVAPGARLEVLQKWAAQRLATSVENRMRESGEGGDGGGPSGSRRGCGDVVLSTLSGRPVTRPGDDVLPGDVLHAQWADQDDRFQLVGGKRMMAPRVRRKKKMMAIWRREERALERARSGAGALKLNEPHWSEDFTDSQGGSICVFLDPERFDEWRSAASAKKRERREEKRRERQERRAAREAKPAKSKKAGTSLMSRLTRGKQQQNSSSSSSTSDSGSDSSTISSDPPFLPESDEEFLWMEFGESLGSYGRRSKIRVHVAFGTIDEVCSAPVPRKKVSAHAELLSSSSSGSGSESESGSDPEFDLEQFVAGALAGPDVEVIHLDSPDDDEFCLQSEFHSLQKSRPQNDDTNSAGAVADTASSVRRRARFRSVTLAIGKYYTWRGFRLSVAAKDQMPAVLVEGSTGSLVKAARG